MTILNVYRAEKNTGIYFITREVALLEQDDVYFISFTERATGYGESIKHYCSVDYYNVNQARARYIQEVKQCKDIGYTTKENK